MLLILENCYAVIIELDLSEGENKICQDLDGYVKNCVAKNQEACFPKPYRQLAK